MAWTFGPLLIEGNLHTVDPVTVETPFEAGPPRKKRVSTDETNRVLGTVYLPDAATLQAWWVHWEGDANYGADYFDMPLHIQGVSADHSCRISNPQLTKRGTGYFLTLAVETQERLTS